MPPAEPVADAVRAFYRDMPFNYHGSAAQAVDALRANPIAAYPDLDALLEEDEVHSVLELGCGAGWATNAMALHYGKSVVAVDFTDMALARAAEVAAQVGVAHQVRFVSGDILAFKAETLFDLVVSIGVLHHTADCRAAFAHAGRMVKPGGHLFVGLYHLQSRQVFLQMYRDILASEGEAAARARFFAQAGDKLDPDHALSWFRDQVLHPHETQHTLEEVCDWLDADGFSLVSTNLTGYGATDDKQEMAAADRRFGALSHQRNIVEGRFFPGFFTVLALRKPDAEQGS